MPNTNKDQSEINKFSELASKWWDTTSEFKPLHAINPLRLHWIQEHASISEKKVLDIGCGGGILSESMAFEGANTFGIDLSEKALQVADLHGLESGVKVQYECISAEEFAIKHPNEFDVVTCMEMLEHVPDPASVVCAAATLCKPGGTIFFSTLNRNPKSYLMAIIGAEYLLRMLPRGTHDYAKFLKPSELAQFVQQAGLELLDITGMHYNPLTDIYSLGPNTDVNYMICCKKTNLSA